MRNSLFLILAACALLLASNFVLDPSGYPIRILCLVFLTAAMAQSWNILGGLANQVSLGHAAFFGIGAYTSTVLLVEFGLSPWFGMIAGAALAGVAAVILSIPTSKLKGHYFALATLAFSEACRVVANSVSFTGGPQGISVPYVGDSWAMMQFRTAGGYTPLIALLFFVVFFTYAAVSHSRLGYMLKGIRGNESAAELSGISTATVKVKGIVISAALAAICGTVFAQFIFFLDPDSIFSPLGISVRMVLVAIIGGTATLAGPFVGAVVFILLEEVSRTWLSTFPSGASPLLLGVIMIAIVLWRPDGLISLITPVVRRLTFRTGKKGSQNDEAT